MKTFFDPEHVDRPTPDHPWPALLGAAVVLVAVMLAGWEAYWRSKQFAPGDYANTAALWAENRRRVVGDATVLIGSSRILFGLNLDVWEEATGVRPVQLALEGTSPRIFLEDLAKDEGFHGLVIVGVTAPLFFTTSGGFRAEALEHYRTETLSERWDHQLSKPLEANIAFFDEQTRVKRRIELAPLPLREGMKPLFDVRKLETMGPDRAAAMWSRVETDERYRDEARTIWEIGTRNNMPPPGPDGKPPEMPDEAIDAVVAEVKANVDKIRARGGEVVFVRFPFSGAYDFEYFAFPRERFWDRLIAGVDAVGVTFEDHPELQGFDLPEWSHLSAAEAERYTQALEPILRRALEARRSPA